MSANPVARPQSSRRSFLTAGAAGLAAGGVTFGAIAATTAPDPVFALLEAERRADAALDAACEVSDRCQTAFQESGFSREARVQVGTMTAIVGPGGEPLPDDEWIARPFYLATPAEVRDYFRRDPDRAEIFVARLEADEAAIARARELSGIEAAEARQEELGEALLDAEAALYDATPTTRAGLLAMLARFEERELQMVSDPVDGYLLGLFAAVRAIVGGEA